MIVAILLLVTLALIYVFIVRPILKKQPAMSATFAAEATIGQKIQAKITGWKTYIVAWLTTIAGLVIGLYDQILPLAAGMDWTPITSKLPGWALPVGMVCLGLMFAWLRKVTDNPPTLVVQKDDMGDAKIVDIIPAPKV
jgi:predicted permease